MTDAEKIYSDIEAIRAKAPLVLNITNYVVTNNTANALLALGASPIMSHAVEEMAELVAISGALVINLGTVAPEYLAAMEPAWTAADKAGVPTILDPVGAGASLLRTVTPLALLADHKPFIIRGNASEITTLAGGEGGAKGVDSTASSESAVTVARVLRKKYGGAVVVSGEVDIVAGEGIRVQVMGGSPLMPRVTGLGCTASALCGAFAAVNKNPFEAALGATVTMKVAGEIAAAKASGPGTLQLHFYDALYNLSLQDVEDHIKLVR